MVLSDVGITKALIRLSTFIVRNPPKTGFLVSRPICKVVYLFGVTSLPDGTSCLPSDQI